MHQEPHKHEPTQPQPDQEHDELQREQPDKADERNASLFRQLNPGFMVIVPNPGYII